MTKKKCKDCNKSKLLFDFYGVQGECKECTKKRVHLNEKKNKEYYRQYYIDRQKNNIKFIFTHRYSGMKTRVEGRSNCKSLSIGKELCSIEDFMKWCYSEKVFKQFKKLHKQWKKNNYCRKLCPSIDRIDNNKGYIIKNMQWITQQQNSSKYIN